MSYDVLQGVARKLDVVLTAQSNGIDAVTNAAYTDLVVYYSKEGDVAANLKSVGVGDWINLGYGVYRLAFTVGELNTLGSFTYYVGLAGAYSCVAFMPYYGHVEVVSGDITALTTSVGIVSNSLTVVGNNVLGVSGAVVGVGSQVTTVGNNVLGVSGAVVGVGSQVTTVGDNVLEVSEDIGTLQIAVDDLNNYAVGAGAYYDVDAGTLTVSLVLHKNGVVVSSPTSAIVAGYDEDGTLLFTDTSISPDAQGVFKFVETVTLIERTVPYIRGTIVDSEGTHHSVTLTPVVA